MGLDGSTGGPLRAPRSDENTILASNKKVLTWGPVAFIYFSALSSQLSTAGLGFDDGPTAVRWAISEALK